MTRANAGIYVVINRRMIKRFKRGQVAEIKEEADWRTLFDLLMVLHHEKAPGSQGLSDL